MRQRITFIHKPEQGIDVQELQIAGYSLGGPEFLAAREDRITLALDELPAELSDVLQSCHELHVRWVSPLAYETVAPLLSRLSPGFHLFYTPGKTRGEVEDGPDTAMLCQALSKSFGIQICSSSRAFARLPNDRFSHSAALYFYEPRENLNSLVDYLSTRICATLGGHGDSAVSHCRERAERLRDAASLDISYDTISHALKVTAQWPKKRQSVSVSSLPGHRTEVGILGEDPSVRTEAEEVGISGALTVLGDQKTPSPVMFAVPSRHRVSGASFSSAFVSPTGLHPTLRLRISSGQRPREDASCALHAYFTLPKSIFPDRYQLSDELFLRSKNLTALRYASSPIDLEAPAYATETWGSSILLELTPPTSGEKEDEASGPWTAEVPLHLRYLAPNSDGYAEVEAPYPAVFWACPAEEGTKFPNNPFDRVHLGYDALFGPRTAFWHVEPRAEDAGGSGGRLMSPIRVPVLDEDDASWVRAGTAAAVVVGFAWVLWTLVAAYMKSGYGREKESREAKKKQ
ncbi:PIG-X-domain-containing protein [Sodiomyces alkalinus F11]|uniref:Protein PBN1 n=1 Tax=Sodiomyces alkalinus (strain CBS 110278 / VKM F-3762 / F11) TaxID=1314773 RepID=A0A3N2PNC1_SODAK|nr:PIG-X-domain-containing protein [Sodiomyces alkalinus F11]ROT35920.1 PIG-X-domain-containing protein [Sodiomyces alkalinus F11]